MIDFQFTPYTSLNTSYEAFMLAIAIIGGLGGLLEAYRIARYSSAKNADYATWLVLLVGAVLWLYYSLMLGNVIILAGSSVGAFSALAAIFAVWWYHPPGAGYMPTN